MSTSGAKRPSTSERSSAVARASALNSAGASAPRSVPSGVRSATACSTSELSRMRSTSDQGVTTISSASSWSPSARCSMEISVQCPSRLPSVQYSHIVVSADAEPLRSSALPYASRTRSRMRAVMRTTTRSSRSCSRLTSPTYSICGSPRISTSLRQPRWAKSSRRRCHSTSRSDPSSSDRRRRSPADQACSMRVNSARVSRSTTSGANAASFSAASSAASRTRCHTGPAPARVAPGSEQHCGGEHEAERDEHDDRARRQAGAVRAEAEADAAPEAPTEPATAASEPAASEPAAPAEPRAPAPAQRECAAGPAQQPAEHQQPGADRRCPA